MSVFSGAPDSSSSSATTPTNFDSLARSCLVRPLMAHKKEMYTLVLEPLLRQGGVHFWRGTLHAVLRMVTDMQGQRRDDKGS